MSEQDATSGQKDIRTPGRIDETIPEKTERTIDEARRQFLGKGLLGAAALVATVAAPYPVDARSRDRREERGRRGERRGRQGRRLRERAARRDCPLRMPRQRTNGDEERFGAVASFTKGLRHNSLGLANEVERVRLMRTIKSGKFDELDQFELGSRRFVDPQAALAFGIEGVDPQSMAIPPAPAFDSAEVAGEMVELYWQAALRDVSFTDYDTDPQVSAAVNGLNAMSDFRGPKANGAVTPGTLFRGSTAGDLVGPYVSQLLLKQIPMGSLQVEQRQRTVLPLDYLTDFESWLNVQNGNYKAELPAFDPTPRFIRNGRDLTAYVHGDLAFQAYFNAAAQLSARDLLAPDALALKLDSGNPHLRNSSTEGFAMFGDFHFYTMLGKVTDIAARTVWYQKWCIHRRLRPEAFAGRVHTNRNGLTAHVIHPELLNADILDTMVSSHGTYLLPQAFIEGSPMHPSYGAGHATIAGACTTVLKAFFEEGFPIADPVVPNADGTALVPYTGPDAGSMTIGGELNKLAANIAIGRNFAGVHYRSDYYESILLGEAVAIRLLQTLTATYPAPSAFHLTRFDGTQIQIAGGGVRARG